MRIGLRLLAVGAARDIGTLIFDPVEHATVHTTLAPIHTVVADADEDIAVVGAFPAFFTTEELSKSADWDAPGRNRGSEGAEEESLDGDGSEARHNVLS